MATPLSLLKAPGGVPGFSSFGTKYVRDKYGNYKDKWGYTPTQRWRERIRQQTGRFPTTQQEQAWTMNNIPGARYGLNSQADPYGKNFRPTPPPSGPVAPPQATFQDPGLPPAAPGFRRFGPGGAQLPPGLMEVMQGLRRNPQMQQPPQQPQQAAPSRLPDFWGIVNNAASYDARGQTPQAAVRRFGWQD